MASSPALTKSFAVVLNISCTRTVPSGAIPTFSSTLTIVCVSVMPTGVCLNPPKDKYSPERDKYQGSSLASCNPLFESKASITSNPASFKQSTTTSSLTISGKPFPTSIPNLSFLCSLFEESYFEVDNGFCNTDLLGPITDIVKRYSLMTASDSHFDASQLDQSDPDTYLQWRQTLFGAWRAAFFYRSGGYKWRFVGSDPTYAQFPVNFKEKLNSPYFPSTTAFKRLTVPQVSVLPFGYLGIADPIQLLEVGPVGSTETNFYVAARDDVQFGMPILPSYFAPSLSRSDKSKEMPPSGGKFPGMELLKRDTRKGQLRDSNLYVKTPYTEKFGSRDEFVMVKNDKQAITRRAL